jgi:hypothetical protein
MSEIKSAKTLKKESKKRVKVMKEAAKAKRKLRKEQGEDPPEDDELIILAPKPIHAVDTVVHEKVPYFSSSGQFWRWFRCFHYLRCPRCWKDCQEYDIEDDINIADN